MARVCTVCAHAEREAIDKLLIAGVALRDIAGRYGLSKSSLERHKANHVPAALAQAKEAAEVAQADDLLGELRKLQKITMGLLSQGYSAGDLRVAVAAVGQARANLELMAEITGELERRNLTQIAIVQSPAWQALRDGLIRGLLPIPGAVERVGEILEGVECSKT